MKKSAPTARPLSVVLLKLFRRAYNLSNGSLPAPACPICILGHNEKERHKKSLSEL